MEDRSPQTARALALILEDCARLARTERRPSAATRLEKRVGGRLARLLLAGLVGDHRRRPSAV